MVFKFFSFILVGCSPPQKTEEQRGLILSKEPENLIFMAEAKAIFGENILENGRSFSSYSSYMVLYDIKDYNMNLDQWLNKDRLIKNNGWIFLSKLNNSYIYCKGKTQFEVVVPQSIVKNSKLEDGNLLTQSKDEWVIGFDTPKTNSINICEENFIKSEL